ncbi:MAG: aminotransferase class IV [Tepidisphaeraceae bacterium]|jgi:branched-chain amino acid aminotransferase
MSQVWINGTFLEEEDAHVSLRDTGLLHAAGVFTTMRSAAAKVFHLAHHLQRLRQSCEALFIPLQYDDETITSAVHQLLQRNHLAQARLRLTVTRGSARQDPLHGLRLEPAVFLTATPLEPYPEDFYQRGMTAIALDEQKANPYDAQAGHKTLNYFSRLAALRAANSRGAGEAIWFNVHNFVESGSISNIFLVKNEKLLTPPTNLDLRDPSIADQTPYAKAVALPGITRSAVLDLAKISQIEIQIRGLTINDLLEADEAFLTNSIMRIMPLCRVERRALGDDKPGKITQSLSAAYTKLVDTAPE